MKNEQYRLDSKILYFFLVVILLATSSFVYRYYSVQECPQIQFTVSADTIEAGQMVMFTNRTEGVTEAQWDFGDNSRLVHDIHATHTFAAAGEYTLRLTVNGGCTELKRLYVRAKKPLLDHSMVPQFEAPASIEINKKIRFKCLTEEATSYEWRFGETGKVDSREKNPSYKYSSPGLKTVSLVLNGNDKYIAKQMVHVMTPAIPKAPPKPIEKKKDNSAKQVQHIPQTPDDYASYDALKVDVAEAPKEKVKAATNDELESMIRNYTQGVVKEGQFRPSFCDKMENSLVEANGRLTKFPDFLAAIRGENLRIKELRTIRGEGGCIQQVIIRYRK